MGNWHGKQRREQLCARDRISLKPLAGQPHGRRMHTATQLAMQPHLLPQLYHNDGCMWYVLMQADARVK